jgi:hypothetical protein
MVRAKISVRVRMMMRAMIRVRVRG